jgi:hypothetical protein
MAKKAKRRLTEELLETAQDMCASGIMSAAAHEKITMRHLGATASTIPPRRVGRDSALALPPPRKNS